MPIYGPRTDADFANTDLVTLSGGTVYSRNSLILDPKDRSPNRNWREIAEDGTPRSWGIDLPPRRVGSNPYISRPGNFSGGTAEEADPPRQDTLTKQVGVPISIGRAFSNHKSLIFGWQPEYRKQKLSRLIAPPGPEVVVIASGKKGFTADTYGVRIDFRRTRRGERTLPSGYSFPVLLTGQGFRVFIPPEAISSGANFMGVYVTRPGSGGLLGTEREQEVANLRNLAATGYVDVNGPYHDNGRRPATRDESGIGSPASPLFRRKHGRAYVHKASANFDLREGIYRFGFEVEKGGGISLISDKTEQVTITGDTKKKEQRRQLAQGEEPNNDEQVKVITGVRYAVKQVDVQLHYQENTAFWFSFPGLPKGWRIIPIIYWQPLGAGDGIWYRLIHSSARTGAEFSYGEDRMDKGVPIYGYPPGTQPGKLDDTLVDMGPPGKEDTTVLPAPDSASGPDVKANDIALMDAPANYWCAATDEDEFGKETALSEKPVDPADTTGRRSFRLASAGQGVRLFFSQVTNRLRNPEGAERAADGTVYNWNNLGTGATSTAVFQDGSLILTGTSSGTSLSPETDFITIPDESSDLSVKGQLRVTRNVGASTATRYILRYFDDQATPVQVGSDVVLLEINATGKISLGETGKTYGPSGTAIPDGATQFKLVCKGIGASWNGTAYFENMGVFFYPQALRKFERVAPDQPVVFNPTSLSIGTSAGTATPYPSSSTHAVGPVQAAEEAAPTAEPLVEVVDFESGAWPAAWSTSGMGNTFSDSVISSNVIFGTRSVEHDSQTVTNVQTSLRRRTYTNADLTAWGGSAVTSLHVRWYDANPKLPTKGELLRARILDASNTVMGSVYYTSTGARLYRHKSDGTRDTYVQVLTGLSNNIPVDFELGVTNADTTNGTITASAGTNGNSRTSVGKHTGRNFSGRKPRAIDFGAKETNAGAKWTMRADNILVSVSGAPLNYESLGSPSGTTVPTPVPSPDAPPLSGGGFRIYDYLNDPLNQWWFFIEPGVEKADGQDYGPYCEDIISVVPGETITQAIQGGYKMFETPEEPSHQFFITLYGPGVAPIEVGSPFAAGKDATAASRAGGSRMNNAVTVGMSTSASIANTEDFWQTFVIPSGYLWAMIGPKNGVGGSYVFQEHLFAKGNLTTQAARDAARDYGRATSGSATVVIPAFPERNPYRWPLNADRMALGIRQGALQAGASVSNVLYSSGPTRTGPWSTPTAEQLDVPEDRYYRVTFDMAGETGVDGAFPSIPPGGVFAALRPYMSVLLKADRSEIPGGVFVNGVDSPSSRGRSDILEIDGDVVAARRSKDVSYFTKALTFHVATEEGKRYLESLYADDDLVIEDPFLMGSGRLLRIRPGVDLTVDTSLQTAYIANEERNVYGIGQMPAAQVIEESPLIS